MCTIDQLARDEWDREPDLSLLHVGAQQLISKQAVQEQLDILLEACKLKKEEVEIIGSDNTLSRRWSVSFARKIKGTHTLAARRVANVMGSLRGDDGQWREMEVRTPKGGKARLFVNRDQNPQQGAVERHTKFARAAVEEVVGVDSSVTMQKRDGTVAIDWHPVVRVFAPRKDQIELRFHPAGERATKISAIDKENIRKRFRELSGRIPEDEW